MSYELLLRAALESAFDSFSGFTPDTSRLLVLADWMEENSDSASEVIRMMAEDRTKMPCAFVGDKRIYFVSMQDYGVQVFCRLRILQEEPEKQCQRHLNGEIRPRMWQLARVGFFGIARAYIMLFEAWRQTKEEQQRLKFNGSSLPLEEMRRHDLNEDLVGELATTDDIMNVIHRRTCGCGADAVHEHDGYGCCGGEMCCSEANE